MHSSKVTAVHEAGEGKVYSPKTGKVIENFHFEGEPDKIIWEVIFVALETKSLQKACQDIKHILETEYIKKES